MPTPVTGECRPLANGFEARIRIDDEGNRKGFELVGIPKTDETAARERTTAMAQIAVRLRRAGRGDKIVDLLKMAAKVRPGKPWEAVVSAVDTLCTEGGAQPLAGAEVPTFVRFGYDWAEGKLHKKWPDHVPLKADTSSED